MKENDDKEKEKIDQPKDKKSGNDRYPQEYEEQENAALRMEPQPLVKPEKK